MLPVSVLILAGICLVLMAHTHQIEQPAPGGSGGEPLNLNETRSSAQLEPLLDFYDNPRDRSFAAVRILSYLHDRDRIDSVNEIREIRVSVQDIKRRGGLTSFAERLTKLENSDGSESVPLLTSAHVRNLRAKL